MKCRTVNKQISLYLDGRLADRERALLEAHLQECSGCRAEVESLRQALAALKTLTRPIPRPGGWERLEARLRQKSQPAARPVAGVRLVPGGLRWGAAGVAAALVVLTLVSAPWRGPSAPRVASVPPAVSTVPQLPAPGPMVASAGAVSSVRPSAVAPARPAVQVRAQVVVSRKHRVASRRSLREPDPEIAYADDSSASREEAESMVSQGMEPLVAAAQAETDPLDWLSDVSEEDWL